MAQFDIHSRSSVETALNVQAITTDTTTVGNIIDMQDQQSLELIFIAGAISAGTLTVKVEHGESATLADAAVVPADYLLGTAAFTTTDANKSKKVGYVGKSRYVRTSIVSTGTANGTIGALALKANPGISGVDALS